MLPIRRPDKDTVAELMLGLAAATYFLAFFIAVHVAMARLIY